METSRLRGTGAARLGAWAATIPATTKMSTPGRRTDSQASQWVKSVVK